MRREVVWSASSTVCQQARSDGCLAFGQDRRGFGTPHHQGQSLADPGMFGHQWRRGQGRHGMGLQKCCKIAHLAPSQSVLLNKFIEKCLQFAMSC